MISGYAVSKAGITRFVENLSEELKDYNIDINAVAPGAINTNMLDEVLRASPKKIGTYYYKKALRQKESLGITHGKEYMFIPYGELRKAKQYTKDIFYSKFDSKPYKLIDFEWKPYKEPNPNQNKLL